MTATKLIFMLDYKGDLAQIGGTSNYLKLLAPRVRKAGFDVRVAMPNSPRTDNLRNALQEANIPVDEVDTSPQAGNAFQRLYSAFVYMKTQHPDIVHFMMPWWNACEYGILGASLANVPARVATYTAVPASLEPEIYTGWAGSVRRLKQHFVTKGINRVTSVSENIRSRLINLGFYSPDIVQTVHCAIDAEEFAADDQRSGFRDEWDVSASDILIIMIGMLEEIKGHRYLIKALPGILQQHANVRVAVIGDGIFRKPLEELVQSENLSEFVFFTGLQTDVARILTAADLFVLPSLSEGLPFVVLEAMAAGLPVVASCVGGVSEAVINGETGLLVEPASPKALHNAIVSLLDKPDHAKAMGRSGQAYVGSHFDIERMVARTCEVYRQLLESKR